MKNPMPGQIVEQLENDLQEINSVEHDEISKAEHDRAFEKSGTGGYGLELKDSYLAVNGEKVPGTVTDLGHNTFRVNHSQHITKSDDGSILFKTKVRTKHGHSVGIIEFKKIEFN